MTDKNNKFLEEISKSLYSMSADELTSAESRVRAYYDGLHNIINRKTAELDENKTAYIGPEEE